jgi:hypothetical protein
MLQKILNDFHTHPFRGLGQTAAARFWIQPDTTPVLLDHRGMGSEKYIFNNSPRMRFKMHKMFMKASGLLEDTEEEEGYNNGEGSLNYKNYCVDNNIFTFVLKNFLILLAFI